MPGYWDRVWNNYWQTKNALPHLPLLNPLTMSTAPAVAPLVGGLSWGEATAYAGTNLAANAYLAAGMTSIINSALMNGAFNTGILIGSMVSPLVISP